MIRNVVWMMKMADKWIKVIVIAILCISFFSPFFLAPDSLVTVIAGMPGFLFFLIAFHEIGHVLGCRINGNRMTSLKILLLSFSQEGLKIRPGQDWSSYLSFIRSSNDTVVYLGGIIASLIAAAAVILGYLAFRLPVLKYYGLVSVFHFAKNAIPYGKSDMKQVLSSIKEH